MYPDSSLCPPQIIESLELYRDEGVPPGSFLNACLNNDLMEAVGRADAVNCELLPHIVAWIYSYMPRGSWGAPELVEQWLETKKLQRHWWREWSFPDLSPRDNAIIAVARRRGFATFFPVSNEAGWQAKATLDAAADFLHLDNPDTYFNDTKLANEVDLIEVAMKEFTHA